MAQGKEMTRRAVFSIVLMALMGCSDPLLPYEENWRLTSLRILPETSEPTLIDLNENGQALWHEGDRTVLWDNGEIHQVPIGGLYRFGTSDGFPQGLYLGSSGEVLGRVDGVATLWQDGVITTITGVPRGILEDGTVYVERNDTMFTWKEGTLTASNRPGGYQVGPEGRIWSSQNIEPPQLGAEMVCGFYQDGEWHPVLVAGYCVPVAAEENGWALADAAGGMNPAVTVMHPETWFQISYLDRAGSPDAIHVNSRGDAISEGGILVRADEMDDRVDLSQDFEGALRLGAINDDGEILAQLDNRVVLLTPR